MKRSVNTAKIGVPSSVILPQRQVGAIGILGALVLVLFVSVLALVIDATRLYAEQRQLQGVTDAAALQAAQIAGLCSDATENDVIAAAQAAAVQNGYDHDLSEGLNGVQLGHIKVDDEGIRQFVTATGGYNPEAVQVTAHQEVAASVTAGGLWGDTVNLQARSTARRLPQGVVSVSSLLVGVDSQDAGILNDTLNALIGGQLNLDAVSYAGLADAQVRLGDFIESAPAAGIDLSAADVDSLLEAELTLAQALDLTLEAMDHAGVADPGVANALVGETHYAQLTLGDVIALSVPAPEGVQQARITVLDLVWALALRANQDQAVDVALGADLDLGSLAGVTAHLQLFVIEPPQIAVGPPGRGPDGEWRTYAETAQVRVGVSGHASSDLLGLVNAEATLGTVSEVARGAAWLESVQCPTMGNGSDETLVDIGAQPGVASLALGGFSNIEGDGAVIDNSNIEVTLLSGLGSVDASLQAPTGDEPVHFAADARRLDYGVGSLPQTQRTAGGVGSALEEGLTQLADGLEVDVTVNLLGLELGVSDSEIADALISELLAPLVGGLDAILEPLFALAGIQVGAADVTLVDLDEDGAEIVS